MGEDLFAAAASPCAYAGTGIASTPADTSIIEFAAARILVIECISNGSVFWRIEAIGGN